MRPLAARLLFLTTLSFIACRSSGPPPAAYRLVDHSRFPTDATVLIDGVHKRVLDATQAEDVFDLATPWPQALLSFSVGLERIPERGTVRFQIEFAGPSGDRAELYAREFSTAGWVDERVELPVHGGAGRLILRKQLVEGPRAVFLHSTWGDPVVLPERGPDPKSTSVILVSIDTLRADRVGLYGHRAARTPVLDALGQRGVWYRSAYSPSTWTLPSHASLFYGRHLAEVPRARPEARDASTASARPQSLAEVLRDAGYLTAAFTGGGFLSELFAFWRGFDTYYTFPQPWPTRHGDCPPERFDGPEVFGRAVAWLRDHGHVPFFLFVHTYDVHDRCPFATWPFNGPWPRLKPPENLRLLSYYDDLLAATDGRLGELLEEVERLGQSDTTLLVVTGDHGELFSEHDLRGHGCLLKPYEQLVRVPLIVRYPASVKPRGEIATPVSLVDVAPTILTLLRLPKPSSMGGHVLPGLGLAAEPPVRPIYVGCGDLLAVRQGAFKLIASKTGAFASELYNLEYDPGERKKLVRFPRTMGRLSRLAEAYWQANAGQESGGLPKLDPETRERLRALGYVE